MHANLAFISDSHVHSIQKNMQQNNFDNELAREWYKCTFHITAFDVVFQFKVSNA